MTIITHQQEVELMGTLHFTLGPIKSPQKLLIFSVKEFAHEDWDCSILLISMELRERILAQPEIKHRPVEKKQ